MAYCCELLVGSNPPCSCTGTFFKALLVLESLLKLRYKPVPCSQTCNGDGKQHFNGKNDTVCDVKSGIEKAALPIAAQAANAGEGLSLPA